MLEFKIFLDLVTSTPPEKSWKHATGNQPWYRLLYHSSLNIALWSVVCFRCAIRLNFSEIPTLFERFRSRLEIKPPPSDPSRNREWKSVKQNHRPRLTNNVRTCLRAKDHQGGFHATEITVDREHYATDATLSRVYLRVP